MYFALVFDLPRYIWITFNSIRLGFYLFLCEKSNYVHYMLASSNFYFLLVWFGLNCFIFFLRNEHIVLTSL